MTPPEALPAWMQPRRREIDWRLLLVAVLCIPALWGFLTTPGLPAENDSALYIARALQTADLLRSGTLYSRLAPEFYRGLGSPLFTYLAPLPHALSGLHILITDVAATDSVRLIFCTALVLAALGMFGLARSRLGADCGVLSALLYLYSAPLLDDLAHRLGDLAALLSFGLLPCAAWALDHAAGTVRRRDHALAVIMVAAWLLADMRYWTGGLVVLCVVIGISKRPRLLALLFAQSVLLCAFFWLPAFVERGLVQWVPAALEGTLFPSFVLERVLPVIVLFGAALAGGAVLSRARKFPQNYQRAALAFACGLVLLPALPTALRPQPPGATAPDTLDETRLGTYATLRNGYLLPALATEPGFLNIEPSQPVRASAFGQFGVTLVEREPLSSHYTVNLGSAQVFRFDRYAWPGWSIAIDGEPHEGSTDAGGLLTGEVPPTAREVVISYGTTLDRILGWLISLFGAGLFLVRGRAISSAAA